jgi:hypothetical protein
MAWLCFGPLSIGASVKRFLTGCQTGQTLEPNAALLQQGHHLNQVL